MAMRTLKVRDDIPVYLEARLQNKWGFLVQKKLTESKYILFGKPYISDKEPEKPAVIAPTNNDNKVIPLFQNKLTKFEQAALERRCENIVNFFTDPYNSVVPIRTRLHNMSQKLTEAERQYIIDYMDDNFPLVDTGK